MKQKTGYDEHPAWSVLLSLYVYARRAWSTTPGVRETAALFGMDERSYCDQYLSVHTVPGMLTWTGSSSGPDQDLTPDHFAAAFEEAAKYVDP